MRRLTLGEYCGRSVSRKCFSGFTITENRFEAGRQISRHFHDHPHFTFVLQGNFYESYDGLLLECATQSVLFVPPNTPHTDTFGPAGAHTIGVEVSGEAEGRIATCLPRVFEPRVVADLNLGRLGNRLYCEFNSSRKDSALAVESLATEMLVAASRLQSKSRTTEPAWMTDVRNLLHQEFANGVGLSDAAIRVGIHPTHLARAFRKRHKCTLGEYVNRLRVESAATALQETSLPLSEIALQSGFYDEAHFCRAFKAAYGRTPSSFRSARKMR